MPSASPTIVRHPGISRASHPLGLKAVRANIPNLNSASILPCGPRSYIFDIWSMLAILALTIAKVSTFSLASYKAQVYQPICNCSEDLQTWAAFWNAMSFVIDDV
jgi:hypothetical protein